jgi:GTPase involved in cell partitioning and DNA repair
MPVSSAFDRNWWKYGLSVKARIEFRRNLMKNIILIGMPGAGKSTRG